MAEKKQYSESEKELLDTGFLSAISVIYHKLDDSEKKAFANMVSKSGIGEHQLDDAIAAKDSEINCGPGCDYVRGIGCVC